MPDARDLDEDAARIEAGRLLFARPWHFLMRRRLGRRRCRRAEGIEVAFAGRSNVGKSSLINALVGQKALARTSNTPGRTRELNLFGADAGIDHRRHAGLRLRARAEDRSRARGRGRSSTISAAAPTCAASICWSTPATG